MIPSLTFWVQQFGDTKFLLCYVKGVLEVMSWVGPLEIVVLH